MAAFRSEDVERRLIDLLEDTEPRALLEQFARLTRVSGSEDERRAAEYIAARLRAVGRLNATLRRLAPVLVPLGYARGERFDHDPAVPYSAPPRLDAALHVASVPEAMRPFVRTALLRERNKVRAALREALTPVGGVRA